MDDGAAPWTTAMSVITRTVTGVATANTGAIGIAGATAKNGYRDEVRIRRAFISRSDNRGCGGLPPQKHNS
jgi:hypothetical protein